MESVGEVLVTGLLSICLRDARNALCTQWPSRPMPSWLSEAVQRMLDVWFTRVLCGPFSEE